MTTAHHDGTRTVQRLELDVLASHMRCRLFVDARNVFDPEKVENAGLVFEGIGRAGSAGGA